MAACRPPALVALVGALACGGGQSPAAPETSSVERRADNGPANVGGAGPRLAPPAPGVGN